MTASPSPTRILALVLGAVLVGWGSFLTAGFTVEQLRPGGNQSLAWLLFLSLTLAGVVGIILVAMRHFAADHHPCTMSKCGAG